jgi:hypothetical protein
MKKLIFTTAILFTCLAFKVASAQISIGLNIGSQPDWGPVGYDHADYYYLPDIDAYYDVPAHQYIYLDNNVWIHAGYLPARYADYDLYGGYKVVLNERNPWLNDRVYRTRYSAYRGRHGQAIIRNSHDARYRNHYNDVRAQQHFNQRARTQNNRQHQLNQREQRQNVRSKQLNQRAHQVNRREQHVSQQAHHQSRPAQHANHASQHGNAGSHSDHQKGHDQHK